MFTDLYTYLVGKKQYLSWLYKLFYKGLNITPA